MGDSVADTASEGAVRIVDAVVALVLFMVQFGLGAVAFVSYIAIPMSTDSCAYVDCGSEKWITPAMAVVGISPFVGMIFLAGGIYLLFRRKPAIWSPLAGCVTQFLMIAVAWGMATQAGPVG
jgi:hypothetical protein